MSLSGRDIAVPPAQVPAWVQENEVGTLLTVVLETLVVYDARESSVWPTLTYVSDFASLHLRQGGMSTGF